MRVYRNAPRVLLWVIDSCFKLVSLISFALVFPFGSLKEDQFGCLASILGLRSPCHAKIRLLLDEEPDVKKPLRGSELVAGPITQVFNLRGPENDFAVNVTIIKTALPMPLPEVQRKWSLL
ncbi:unnamed protein product [Hymenolepis diminuta]|uniref:Integrin_alpha2 domain-containing protein n=1 Tax=Hymenolepis diminuta TaxID=6216 RepID=A0A0R3SJ85_HYMDI|nr:unnamed protein product [Hymenolepis diminuta]